MVNIPRPVKTFVYYPVNWVKRRTFWNACNYNSYIWQNLGGVVSPMGGIVLCLQPLSSTLFSWWSETFWCDNLRKKLNQQLLFAMPKASSLSGLKVYYGDITGLQVPITLILYLTQQTLKPPAVIGGVMAGLCFDWSRHGHRPLGQ